jgi:hypothetical protein
VDARHKAGHDEFRYKESIEFKHSGALDVLFEAGIDQLALQQVQR